MTNIDIRLYSKIIANRIAPILPKHIKLDQTGFTKGRETRDNIIKTCTLVEYVQRTAIPTCLLAVDVEKAFDRVGWRFLEETLIQIGMGPKMISRILAMYSNSRAKVRVNGILSEYIKISNGTRQGCPLLPLLYILVIEHLITAIRKNKDINGIKIKDIKYKTAIYADDLLIYVTNPIITIPNLIKEFKRFGELSNFKVNYDKSEVLNISLLKKHTHFCKKIFHLNGIKKQLNI